MLRRLTIFHLVLFIFVGCVPKTSEVIPLTTESWEERRVVIIVIDGARISETWNDPVRRLIPEQNQLASEGILFTNFYNLGPTLTLPGHTAITTGHYENVINNGKELPSHHSIFQSFLRDHSLPPEKAQLFTGKSKLDVLGNCKDINWFKSYQPKVNAVDRLDAETKEEVLFRMKQDQPLLTLVHFKGPDIAGHADDWDGYISALRETDEYVGEIWDFLEEDKFYQGKTTLLVTSDHGRHTTGINSGFGEHGDACDGCRHIFLLAKGPNLPKGEVITSIYEQVDISSTVAQLMGFRWEGQGKRIDELLNR